MGKEHRIDFRKLLLDCIHRDRSRFPSQILEGMDQSQWQVLVGLAAQQRIMPQFEQRLKQADITSEPAQQIAKDIALYTRQVAMDNLRYFSELEAILEQTNRENIPVILLKGMHLAMEVYPEKRYREMNDMDLLFRVQDLPRVVSIFLEMGYKETAPVRIENAMRTNNHLETLLKDNKVAVEVHWNITLPFDKYSISPDDLWQRCLSTEYRGLSVQVLDPEDLLLHICQHNSYHHLFAFGLRPFYDIKEIIRHFDGQLNWQLIMERASEYHWTQGLLLTLWMARNMIGADVPSEVFSELKSNDRFTHLTSLAEEQIFVNKDDSRGLGSPLEKVTEYSRPSEKVSYLMKRIFLSRNEIAAIFGVPPDSPLIYKYYFLLYWKKVVRIARHFFLSKDQNSKENLKAILSRKKKIKRWLYK